jgi:hypothetical protein
MQGAANEVKSAFVAGRKQLEAALDWPVDFTPRIILVNDSRHFSQWAPSPHILAFAVPAQTLIVIDWNRLARKPIRLQRTLKHELCHLQLHRHIARANLPLWLDEGIAQWASGGFSELMSTGAPVQLDRAMLSGDWLPLTRLNTSFPRSFSGQRLAYAESLSLVTYIVHKHGRNGLLRLLRCLEQDESVDAAFRHSLGVSPADLEQDWKAYLARRTTWLTLVAANIYEIIFTLAALLAVAGGIRMALRKRGGPANSDSQDQ